MLMMRVNHEHRKHVGKAYVPGLDEYLDRVHLALWPRFKVGSCGMCVWLRSWLCCWKCQRRRIGWEQGENGMRVRIRDKGSEYVKAWWGGELPCHGDDISIFASLSV